MSILSREMDGFHFYYGYYRNDRRQINVRQEGADWVAYVGGEPIGRYQSKAAAEAGAIQYIEANPEANDD